MTATDYGLIGLGLTFLTYAVFASRSYGKLEQKVEDQNQRVLRVEARQDKTEADIRAALDKAVADIRHIVGEVNSRVDRLLEHIARREG